MKNIIIILTVLILAISCEKEQPTQNSFKTITPIETKQFVFNTYSQDANNTFANDSELYSGFVNDFQFVRTLAKGDTMKLRVFANYNGAIVKLNIVENGLVIFNMQGKGIIKHNFVFE